MKKSKIIFCSLFFLSLGVMLFGWLGNFLYLRKSKEQRPFYIRVDFEEQYPFEDSYIPIKKENFIVRKYLQICNYFHNVGSYTDTYFPYRYKICEFYGKLFKICNIDIIKDSDSTIINCGNGYCAFFDKQHYDVRDYLNPFVDWCINNDVKFNFILAPHKQIPQEKQVSGVLYDRNYSYKKELLKALEEKSISYLDLQDVFPEDYDTYMSYFYKTDHHWTIETGLHVTKILTEFWNENFGLNLDTDRLNPHLYNMDTYEKIFLGSQGKKVTMGYCEVDDFSIIKPKFDTNFNLSIPSVGLDAKGDFNLFLCMDNLKYDPYNNSQYTVYSYGDQPLIVSKNLDSEDNTKILLIHDSFSDCVIPFLGIVLTELHCIDLRQFNGSLKSYINKNGPFDLVVFMTQYAGSELPITGDHYDLWDLQ